MTLNTRFPPPRLGYPVNDIQDKSESVVGSINIDSLPRLPQKSEPDSTSSGNTYDSDRLSFSPSVWDSFRCVDTGCATYRFARPTANHIPAWPSLELAASIPLACIYTPFATPALNEECVPLVNFTNGLEGHLIRCRRCNAFVNPFFKWFDEGYSFECNICRSVSPVPAEYYSPINVSGVRKDKFSRSELRCGSVDFLVPDHSNTSPPSLVFVIDSSYTPCNFFSSVLSALKTNLVNLPIETQIAIMFVEKSINLLRFGGNEPSLVIVGDVDDPFVPDIASNFFGSPHLLAEQLEAILDGFIATPIEVSAGSRNCANSALSLAADLIGTDTGGGSVVLFQANHCATLIPPDLFDRCSESKICVDVFSWEHSDIAAVDIATRLGGEVAIADANRDSLLDLFHSWIKREKYYNVILKVRCSTGLVVEAIDASGHPLSRGGVHLVVPRMTSKTLLSVKVSVTENLEQTVPVYLQLACLYTREDGTRLTRIHNTLLMPVGHFSSIFKFADQEAIATYITRRSIAEVFRTGMNSIRESAIETVVSILCAYRIHCANRSSSGQLVLPDSLKTLPLLLLGMLKLGGVRRSIGGSKSKGDLARILCWSLFETVASFVPRLYCVFPGPEPVVVPATRVKVIPSRIYCFETANGVVFYVGREVQPDCVRELFGDAVAALGIHPKTSGTVKVQLGQGSDTDRSWVRNTHRLITKHARINQSDHVPVCCIFGGSIVGESKVSSSLLIEDQIDGELCYMDWLCLIHKHIQEHVEY